MAAGLGFKDFTTGEVLTAADVDGYLMQGIWVFASAAARDAAVTSPQEGNFAFLKDTNTTTYYTGSAWTNLDTTGMVNPMTTTGDTIYSSSGSTPARLGIGTAGQVLQVNSGATAPEWATPATGGGMTSLASGSLSGTSVNLTSISGSYQNLRLIVRKVYFGTNANLRFKVNTTGNNSQWNRYYGGSGGPSSTTGAAATGASTIDANINGFVNDSNNVHTTILDIEDYNATTNKLFRLKSWYRISGGGDERQVSILDGAIITSSAVTEIEIIGTSSFSGGTYELFGIK